jgi:transposase-like protein
MPFHLVSFERAAWGGGDKLVRGRDVIRVEGQWCHLYRAIDRDGNLADVQLSNTRDLAAAGALFRSA